MGVASTAQIINIIVGLMVAIVIPYVGYHLAGWLSAAESHIHDQRLRNTVSTLVSAAEQTLVDNASKYTAVYNAAAVAFPMITHDQINSVIEASVLALHTSLNAGSIAPMVGVSDPPAVAPTPV